jgi:hypothetical protein
VVSRERRARGDARRPPCRPGARDVVRQRRPDLRVVCGAVGESRGAARRSSSGSGRRMRRSSSACARMRGNGAGACSSCSSACRRARATTPSSA